MYCLKYTLLLLFVVVIYIICFCVIHLCFSNVSYGCENIYIKKCALDLIWEVFHDAIGAAISSASESTLFIPLLSKYKPDPGLSSVVDSERALQQQQITEGDISLSNKKKKTLILFDFIPLRFIQTLIPRTSPCNREPKPLNSRAEITSPLNGESNDGDPSFRLPPILRPFFHRRVRAVEHIFEFSL